jgi:arylsulfatase A-like enzyme
MARTLGSLPLAVLLLAACAAGAAPRPNFVLILADDLDFDYKQDRLAIMPNLRRLREAGVHLVNHVAAQPVCGPSRSSLLAGRYPHNTGYIINDGKESIAAWTRAENNTLGTWLSAAGYYTMYSGKYVNSMEAHVPAGWSRWHGFSSGAGTYNYCAWGLKKRRALRDGSLALLPSASLLPAPRRQCHNVRRCQHHHGAAAL